MRHALASLCCFCTALTAASAIAAPLDVDTAYGSQGVATSFVAVQPAEVGVSQLQPDGKLIVTVTQGLFHSDFPGLGSGDGLGSADYRPNQLSVRRLNSDGSLDTGFGVNGELVFSVLGADFIRKIALQIDGKILLGIDAGTPCTNVSCDPIFLRSSVIARLTPDGALDSSFNGTGMAQVSEFRFAHDVAVQQDGKLLLLGTTALPTSLGPRNWFLTRFNADGSRDATFNQGHSVGSRCIYEGYSLNVQGDGRIVVSGSSSRAGVIGFCIERLFPDGSRDPTLFSETPFENAVTVPRTLESPDGKLLAVGWQQLSLIRGSLPGSVVALRYGADGTLDTTYGTGGKVFIPIGNPAGTVFHLVDAALARDGGLVVLGMQGPSAFFTEKTPVWIRISASGQLDTGFGVNGIALGNAKQRPVGFLRDFEDRWLMVSETTSQFGVVNAEITRFAGDRTDRLNVVEFYNTALDHYFITADPGEAAAIDAGSAGPGWARTGESFKGGGTHFVCRFYGSTSPGPNSHFYTVTPSECGNLKSLQKTTPATQRRWNFEDLDFATTPTSGGNCPVATVPVYRVYNNGFARGIDSNHRFTAKQAIVDQMVSRGWLYEGPQMCAPL